MPHLIPADIPNMTQVRIAGLFKSYDADKDELILEYNGQTTAIYTGCLEPMAFDTMAKIEILGTINRSSYSSFIVEAKILRCINDADLKVHEKIIRLLERAAAKPNQTIY